MHRTTVRTASVPDDPKRSADELRALVKRSEAREELALGRLESAERLAQLGTFDLDPELRDITWSHGLYRLMERDPALGPMRLDEWMEMVPAPERPHVIAGYMRILQTTTGNPLLSYELERTDRRGRRRWLAVGLEPYGEGRGRRWRGSVLDETQARRSVNRNEALAEIGLRALSDEDGRALMESVGEVIRSQLETPLHGVRLLDGSGRLEVLAFRGVSDEDPQFVKAQKLWPGTIQVWCSENRTAAMVSDYETDDRFVRSELMVEHSIRCSISAPVLGTDRVIGLLTAHSPVPGHFDDDDLAFMQALASLVAAALERQRVEQELAELADMRARLVADTLEAEERARRTISEELHDGALQDLLAARQDLIEAEHEPPGPEARAMVERGRTGLEFAVRQLRQAVHALHPVVLQHGGLDAAVRAAADQAARLGGFTTEIEIDQAATGSDDELLLSVVRELLTNAAKHAGARSVRVTVRSDGDRIRLEVADDGLGISREEVSAAPVSGHIGLASVQHRTLAVGGEFGIEATPGGGTTVWATIPRAGTGRA